MWFFEWLGEAMNPGRMGSWELGGRARSRSGPAVSLRFFLALACLAGLCFLVVAYVLPLSGMAAGIVGAVAALYVVLAYFVHPAPEMDNLGWFGGLLDDPFACSDDVNRTLLACKLLLLPGRFVSEAVVDFVRLLRRAA